MLPLYIVDNFVIFTKDVGTFAWLSKLITVYFLCNSHYAIPGKLSILYIIAISNLSPLIVLPNHFFETVAICIAVMNLALLFPLFLSAKW